MLFIHYHVLQFLHTVFQTGMLFAVFSIPALSIYILITVTDLKALSQKTSQIILKFQYTEKKTDAAKTIQF